MARRSKNSEATKGTENSVPQWVQICSAHWKITQMQGCGCQDCMHSLYRKNIRTLVGHRREFHPIAGLTPNKNEAWHLAEIVVAFIASTSPPDLTKKMQLEKWRTWDAKFPRASFARPFQLSVPAALNNEALTQVMDIFSELMFAGQLPSSCVTISWGSMGRDQIGFTQPPQDVHRAFRIHLNQDLSPGRLTRDAVLAIVLHEMIHVYLGRYACFPWTKSACAKGICGKMYQANVGENGHGRAFHHIAKAIEANMGRTLGFTATLGRCDGSATERSAGGARPCNRDASRLYEWMLRDPDFLKSRDDDDIVRARRGPQRRSLLWIPIWLMYRENGGKPRRYSC